MEYKNIIHGISLTIYVYIFSLAGIKKILKNPEMIEAMASIGFNETGTIFIGIAEVLGVLGILAGLFIPSIKNISVLWLMPFAIGALTVHMSYGHTISDYWESLTVCSLGVIILLSDKIFKIIL